MGRLLSSGPSAATKPSWRSSDMAASQGLHARPETAPAVSRRASAMPGYAACPGLVGERRVVLAVDGCRWFRPTSVLVSVPRGATPVWPSSTPRYLSREMRDIQACLDTLVLGSTNGALTALAAICHAHHQLEGMGNGRGQATYVFAKPARASGIHLPSRGTLKETSRAADEDERRLLGRRAEYPTPYPNPSPLCALL